MAALMTVLCEAVHPPHLHSRRRFCRLLWSGPLCGFKAWDGLGQVFDCAAVLLRHVDGVVLQNYDAVGELREPASQQRRERYV